MPVKCASSGATLSATPCQLTQRVTRTPIAPIFASAPRARSATQMPTRPSRRSPRTPKRAEGADQPLLQAIDVGAHVARRGRAPGGCARSSMT